MSDKRAKEYHLYVVRPEDIRQDEKHYLITAKWTLLYTNRKPPKQSRRIDDIKLLPRMAVEWLNEAIREIQREYLMENKSEILRFAKGFNERFEEELRKEREAMRAEEKHGEQGDSEKPGSL